MTEQALVSIVVPVYNRHKYLGTCLKSILNQTYQNLEIILVDDGSTDDSLKICQRYAKEDSRIKVIAQDNLGVSVARNKGLMAATGTYLMFVDSDDTVSPDHCQKAVAVIENTKADICCMGYTKIHETGKKMTDVRDYPLGVISKAQAMKIVIDDSYLWDKVYKTSLVQKFKFPEKKLYEDVYVVYKVFEEAKLIAYAPIITYQYLVRNDSIVSNMSAKNISDQFDSSNQQYLFFQEKYPQVADEMNEFMLIRALRYCTYCPKNYNRQLFAQAKTIIKTSPVDPKTLDRRYQITMKLFRFSEPLALLIFRLRKLTNSQTQKADAQN